MENFAQGVVAGFAISTVVPAMYYFNKAALGTLFVINREIGKALGRILLPPDDDEDCENPKYTPPCPTTSS